MSGRSDLGNCAAVGTSATSSNTGMTPLIGETDLDFLAHPIVPQLEPAFERRRILHACPIAPQHHKHELRLPGGRLDARRELLAGGEAARELLVYASTSKELVLR
jgi:hypothetical protein